MAEEDDKIIPFPGADTPAASSDEPKPLDVAEEAPPPPSFKGPRFKTKRPDKKKKGFAAPKARTAKRPDPDKQRARKKARALRDLRRLAENDETAGALSEWETGFVDTLQERLGAYDAAFRDPEKGGAGEALSYLQQQKLKEIRKKAKKKRP